MTLQSDQQDIADAEAALVALGPLSSSNFDQALVQLRKRKQAQDDIAKIQGNQFSTDGFNLISQVQTAGAQTDKVVVISKFLRTFAEYIATETQALEGTHPTVKSIVDAIPPMGNTP
ncbi:MAG TPA: hypothetical protein VF974_00935 [Patescibacteria group bacterium]